MLSFGRPVSIEVGSGSVKVAQLVVGRGSVRSIRFAREELPPNYRWEIGGDHAPLVAAMRRALDRARIRSRRAVLVIPRSQVTTRISAFPQADREELRRVVEYELADHIPLPIDQVVVDFQALGPSPEQAGLTDVLVVAGPQELAREYLRVADELGLRVVALTVDGLALHDLVRRVDAERDPTQLTVSLELGARATTINVSAGDRLRLTRSVGVGGHQLTRAVQEDLGVDVEPAERLKREEGLRLLSRDPRPPHVAAWLDGLIGEVRRSAFSFGPATVSRLIVTGGALATPGLKEALQAEFKVEPIPLSAEEVFPGSDLHGDGLEGANRCLLAIAGGLLAVGHSVWKISLLPAEVLRTRRGARLRRLAFAGAMAALLAMAGGYLFAARAVKLRSAAAGRLKEQERIADARKAQMEELRAERDRLGEQVASLTEVRIRRYAALELLRAIALYAPDEVVLTNFTFRREQPLEIVGKAPNAALVADLQNLLADSPLVREVSLRSWDRPTVRGNAADEVRFTMRARLWTEPEGAARGTRITPWGGAG